MSKPHVLIGTPAHNQMVTLAYLRTVFDLQERAASRGDVRVSLATTASASIETARSTLASLVLDDRDYTHLLFIDADQGFDPGALWDMLEFGKDVTALASPRKRMDFRALWDKARRIDDWADLQSAATPYVMPDFVLDDAGRIIVRSGFAQVRSIGTGIMLIRRTVFERLAEVGGLVVPNYKPLLELGHSGRLLHCFGTLTDDAGQPLSEDLSFCRRWTRECGGEIWANIEKEVAHVGNFSFRGRLADALRTP